MGGSDVHFPWVGGSGVNFPWVGGSGVHFPWAAGLRSLESLPWIDLFDEQKFTSIIYLKERKKIVGQE